MPALLEDPTSPTIYRTSGQGPYPTPQNPQIPSSIFPRPVTLRDRVTIATLIPFFSPDAVPPRLLAYLSECFNKEIEDGNTYPMMNTLPLDVFGSYWFGNFGAVMVLGDIGGIEAATEMERNGADWNKLCLGSFYIKPNYPGRSSHICNGGFLVTPAARNKGVGKSMGQCYLDWAPQLNYTYSVFNLVYETNTASTKIWDSLGFKRIGRVPGCGNLKSFTEPVDAIIYGRDLKSEEGNVGNEERFDKIRYYLRHSLYPQGADRSEKSRLRSAATHYKLIPAHEGVPEKLMLKDKEVISDPQAQYDIAKAVHLQAHGGINKTTAVIAMKYHWVRIKETVSHVIKNCPECKDTNKPPMLRGGDGTRATRSKTLDSQTNPADLPLPPTPIKQEGSERDPPQPPQAQDSMPPPANLNASNGHDMTQSKQLSQHIPTHVQPNQNVQSDRMSILPHDSDLPNNVNMDGLDSNIDSNLDVDDDFKADHVDIDGHLVAEEISAEDYRAIQQQMGLAPQDDNDLSHTNMQNPDNDMLSYDDMAIDPQIMEQMHALAAEEFEHLHQQHQHQHGHLQQHHDPTFMPPPQNHHNQHHTQHMAVTHSLHQSQHQHQFGDAQRPSSLQQQHSEIHSDPGPNAQYQVDSLNTLSQPPSHHGSHQSSHDPRVFSQRQSPTDFTAHSQPSSQYISPVQGPQSHGMMPVGPDDHIMGGSLDDSSGSMPTGMPGQMSGGGGINPANMNAGPGAGGGMNNMQQIRHVLNMEYMNTGMAQQPPQQPPTPQGQYQQQAPAPQGQYQQQSPTPGGSMQGQQGQYQQQHGRQ